jgi:hypothetical protein
VDKDNVLKWLDISINTLAAFVNMIPGKIDDLALSAIKFLRNDETFLAFLERFESPPENAIFEPPAALIEGLRRWRDAENVELPQGTYMELLGYILQIIRWISDRKKQPAPAPA